MLLSVAALAVAPVPVLQLQNNFLLYPTSLECYLYPGSLLSRKKLFTLEMKPFPWWLFIAVNGNLCIEFYEAVFQVLEYLLSSCVRIVMSAVLFVATNFSSGFSAERTENGEFAGQQILACVAVRVYMCVPIGENNVCVACFVWHV